MTLLWTTFKVIQLEMHQTWGLAICGVNNEHKHANKDTFISDKSNKKHKKF